MDCTVRGREARAMLEQADAFLLPALILFLGLGEVDGSGGLQPRRLIVVAAPDSAPDEGLS